MASDINLTSARSSYKAAFALDVLTAGIALCFLALATRPTFQRIRARRLSIASEDRATPLKTSLGTYLFLYPGLIFIFITYTLAFVTDLLKTTGTIQYDEGLALHGNRPFVDSAYDYSIAILSLVSALLSIFFTVLVNGGVWIYSNHTLANGTGRAAPSLMSKVYNTAIMLTMLGTGLAAWGYGVSARRREDTWAAVVEDDQVTRALFVAYRMVIVAASISVSVEVIRKFAECDRDKKSHMPERTNLARFALVVVPLIWIRNAFIIFDVVLLYVNSAGWPNEAVLASRFLLIVFGQIANLALLGMILWGAWKTGRTVPLVDRPDKESRVSE